MMHSVEPTFQGNDDFPDKKNKGFWFHELQSSVSSLLGGIQETLSKNLFTGFNPGKILRHLPWLGWEGRLSLIFYTLMVCAVSILPWVLLSNAMILPVYAAIILSVVSVIVASFWLIPHFLTFRSQAVQLVVLDIEEDDDELSGEESKSVEKNQFFIDLFAFLSRLIFTGLIAASVYLLATTLCPSALLPTVQFIVGPIVALIGLVGLRVAYEAYQRSRRIIEFEFKADRDDDAKEKVIQYQFLRFMSRRWLPILTIGAIAVYVGVAGSGFAANFLTSGVLSVSIMAVGVVLMAVAGFVAALAYKRMAHEEKSIDAIGTERNMGLILKKGLICLPLLVIGVTAVVAAGQVMTLGIPLLVLGIVSILMSMGLAVYVFRAAVDVKQNRTVWPKYRSLLHYFFGQFVTREFQKSLQDEVDESDDEYDGESFRQKSSGGAQKRVRFSFPEGDVSPLNEASDYFFDDDLYNSPLAEYGSETNAALQSKYPAMWKGEESKRDNEVAEEPKYQELVIKTLLEVLTKEAQQSDEASDSLPLVKHAFRIWSASIREFEHSRNHHFLLGDVSSHPEEDDDLIGFAEAKWRVSGFDSGEQEAFSAYQDNVDERASECYQTLVSRMQNSSNLLNAGSQYGGSRRFGANQCAGYSPRFPPAFSSKFEGQDQLYSTPGAGGGHRYTGGGAGSNLSDNRGASTKYSY